MKKFLCSLILTLSFCATVIAQNSYRQYIATSAAPDTAINQTAGGINYHLLTWTVSGTVSTCAVELDSSSDGVTWTSGGAIGSQACTSSGNSGEVAGTFAYVRINVTTLTGLGATVNVVYTGYNSSGGSSILLQTNGTNNGSQTKLNLAAGTNMTLTDDGSGQVTLTAAATAATAFSGITTGTNTGQTLTVGSGSSIVPSSTGVINANEVNGAVAPTSASVLASNSSKQLIAATTTGSGSVVEANSPTLVTPALGTPSALNLANATNLPCSATPALTGDVTTSAGNCTTTVVKVNGASVPTSALALGTNSSNQLISFSPSWTCSAGLGDGLNAITAGTYLQSTCYNGTGHTITITGIKCYSDNSGSSTMNVTNGTGTGLLTGAITCSSSFASGTQSGTTTVASGDYFKFTFVADGTSKQTTWVIVGSY